MAATHKNMTVTRTISAGNCAGTSTDCQPESAGFPFARRHSSAGILALKWATARSSSFGSSLGLENRGSKDSIRSIVVTPGSIPQFTIPKLALEDGYRPRANEKEQQDEEEDWGSTDDVSSSYHPKLCLSSSVSSSSSSSSVSPVPGRKGISDIKRAQTQGDYSFSSSLVEVEHCSDPASRAALSLPHLPKVTTPYGFVTLSKSPQMASEEALFFQGHRRWGHDEEINTSRHPKLEIKRSVRTSPVQIHASTPPKQPPVAHRFFRSHSVTGIEIQKQLVQSKESIKQVPVSKSKRNLWAILRNKQARKTFDFN